MNLQRLDKAWKRWLVPDKTGKRGGRPKFKSRGEKPSFSFSRVNHPKAACTFLGSVIKIPRIGNVAVIVHRPIPDGFVLKTATICCRADGWYVSISAADESIPEAKLPTLPEVTSGRKAAVHSAPLETIKSAVGVDVGLKVFLATSTGTFVPVPQIYRKAQAHLARQQRTLARREKNSKNQDWQKSRIAKIHQRIARQREKFHYQIAHKLCRDYDLIAVEDLNIRGLARTKMAKSIYDVAWGKFLTVLESVAVKCGVHFVKVSPYNTTQDCSQCGTKVPKTLSIRTHECHKCGLSMDRDENAAVNILEKGLQAVGLTVSACGALVDGQALRQELLDVNLEAYVTAPA